ncbi:Hemicentin-1 Fibulin-6 [Triplophysa tibetana]|uniref:Hemicentin-1 Fibulin-6 n=1 Tax=Triplophysa tibetana TaxID=1572043 RepID=A0A5A9NUL8_9TELE|nr:Hemicentin-1 Fibulin-6 [Triplophysa tibetana]
MNRSVVKFLFLALSISAHDASSSPPVNKISVADDSASTLAFVFDVTGSMYDDLKQVIDGASRILERTLSRRTRPIKNFVLVPFHDPDIGPVSITTDPKKFQEDLQELFVQGGGDCPEMSIGAIKKALEVSLPGSFIYVFTDARAKDYRLKRDVLQLVQLRQSQVVFVLTGDCGDRSQPGYRAYEEIAATSSGQIFHLDKQQVNEVLKWVEETVQAMKVHLLSSDHENAQETQWEVPLDPSLKEVTVSLSGPAPQIELRDPLGIPAHAILKCSGLKPPGLVSNMELMSLGGRSLRTIPVPLPADGGFGGLWSIPEFRTPSQSFFLKVSGKDGDGYNFQRLSSVSYTNIIPEPPLVNMPTVVKAFYMQPATIDCSVNSDLPYKLRFTRDGTTIGDEGTYEMSISESGTLTIRRAAPVDAGNYTCVATNEAGTASQSVTISFAERPSISLTQQVVMIVAGGDATLECHASGTPPPTVTWQKGDLDLGNMPFVEQDVHHGTLQIRGVQELDAGEYTCVATNTAGSASAVVRLEVGAAPAFSLSPMDVTASVGDNITLSCIARGLPTPSLTWRRQDGRPIFVKSSGHSGTSQLPSGALHIQSVWVDDEAVFVCEAKNQFGSIKTQARVTVTGLEPPLLAEGAPAVTVLSGQPLNIPCMLLDGIPLPERVWTHNRKTILPDIKAGPLHYTANEGTAISLSCEASGVPAPSIVWSKGRETKAVSATLEGRDGSLYIPSPKAEDSGVYMCTATSAVGYTNRQMHLSVNTRPRIAGAEGPQAMVEKAAEVGSEVILTCKVHGSPAPLVTWSRNGQPIPPVTAWFTVLPSGSLKIADVRLIDSKFYTCSAVNPAGNVSLTYNLQVQAKPRIQPAPTSLKAPIGQTVVLPCVVQGEPSPQISWFHDGLLVSSERMLKIQTVQHSDSGTYSCVARNSAGEDILEILLQILEAPHFETNGETIIESVTNKRVIIPCPARVLHGSWNSALLSLRATSAFRQKWSHRERNLNYGPLQDEKVFAWVLFEER